MFKNGSKAYFGNFISYLILIIMISIIYLNLSINFDSSIKDLALFFMSIFLISGAVQSLFLCKKYELPTNQAYGLGKAAIFVCDPFRPTPSHLFAQDTSCRHACALGGTIR